MIRKNLSAFTRVVRKDGWRVAASKAASHALGRLPSQLQGKRDIIGYYEYILGKEQGFGVKITPENVPEGSMTWVIPDFNASSGGHINILRMMRLLKKRGFPNQHVVVMEPHRWTSIEEAQSSLNKAFGDFGVTISLGVGSIEPCRYLVATGWQTAYWVAKYRDTVHRLYFVQDFEPAFYAHGSDYVLAENTYRLGLTGITAGSWLAEKLNKEYGMTTLPYSFACDLDLYQPGEPRVSAPKQILFYARPVTPRRCFEIGLLALKRICDNDPDVSVVFAGWDVSDYEIPFAHRNAGTMPLEGLSDLYSQCNVALILSSTNLSLLPLEVAACGCPVVLNDGPQSDWLLSKDEAFYCELSVEGISSALTNVLDNPHKAAEVAQAALKKARSSSWTSEAERIAGYLTAMDSGYTPPSMRGSPS